MDRGAGRRGRVGPFEGYAGSDWIDRIAAPAMREHLRALSWPTDLATPDRGFMIVRASTHGDSLLSQHRAMIGVRIPMLLSAIGRAWLAFCAEDEREATLAMLRARDDAQGELARDAARVRRLIADTRRRGYGLNDGEWTREVSVTAIAFPVLDGERAIGAINLVFMRSVVDLREVRVRYVPLLRSLAAQVSAAIAQGRARAADAAGAVATSALGAPAGARRARAR